VNLSIIRNALVACAVLAASAARAQEPARVSVTAASAAGSLVGFDGRRQDAERTTLTVREVWPGVADTTTIHVAYLRLPARTPQPGSPIVFLMGGPGVPASAIGRVPPYWALFDRLRSVADVVLLDQRGVGLSRPALECAGGSAPAPDLLASTRTLRRALVAAYAQCVAAWRARGVRPELFSVAEIARDVDAVRSRLGAERVSLLGFSYGTRIALEYARLFPSRVDRAVLQGTMGPDDVIRLPATMDSILAAVSAAAARDSVARALAPDLTGALADAFAAADRRPYEVTVRDVAGDSVRITVGRGGLEAIVSGRLADPRLPALAASLRAGDTRVLAALAGGMYRDLANVGSLFGRAVYCSAPASPQRERLARSQEGRWTIREVFDNVPESPSFCREIGIAPGAHAPPPARPGPGAALFVTGTLDDRAPASNAERARAFFASSEMATVENGGHELLPDEQVQTLVAEFFSTGRVSRARIALPPPRFLTVDEALQPPRRR
jgi:pimeloyl-ACP methyl ester carboxylesterase